MGLIAPGQLFSGKVGDFFSQTPAYTGTISSWAATGLPAGLGINATSGLISGTPTTKGSVSSSLTGAGPISASKIAAGAYHSLALKLDGTVVGWGHNNYGQVSIPSNLTNSGDALVIPGSILDIAAGSYHSLALMSDGTVVGWGSNAYGQATPPPPPPGQATLGATAIAAGGREFMSGHSLALRFGAVIGWGSNNYGQATPPSGLAGVVAISAGMEHSLALKSDGTVVAWGSNEHFQATPPGGLAGVVAIAAGGMYSIALKNDGSVVVWGGDDYEFTNQNGSIVAYATSPKVDVFPGPFIAIAAGGEYRTVAILEAGGGVSWRVEGWEPLALSSNGTIYNLGRDGVARSLSALPPAVAIAGGLAHLLALCPAGGGPATTETVVSRGVSVASEAIRTSDDFGQGAIPTETTSRGVSFTISAIILLEASAESAGELQGELDAIILLEASAESAGELQGELGDAIILLEASAESAGELQGELGDAILLLLETAAVSFVMLQAELGAIILLEASAESAGELQGELGDAIILLEAEFISGWPASGVDAELFAYPVFAVDSDIVALLSAQLAYAPVTVLDEIEFGLVCGYQGELSFGVLAVVFESAAEGGMQADMFFEALCISGDIFLHSEIILIVSDAVIYFQSAFLFSSKFSAVMRTALGRGDWLTVVRLGGNEVIDIERERWVALQREEWGNQVPISRSRNLCPELSEEVADLEYQGRFVGPENEVPNAAPVGNRAGMPAPSGQWFAVPASRAVRHFDWEYCNNKPQGCQVVPSSWGHSAELVPYPHVFLQTNAIGPECAPVNRLRNGIGPAMWISHFKGYGLPDFKLIAAVLVKLNALICVGQMNVEPWVNPPSSWGPWEPSPNEICNGAEFTQVSRDLNKLRRPQYRKAIGTSLEDCEYGLPWVPSLGDDMVDLVMFEGQSGGGALWFDEDVLVASAPYLPVGENGASVFVG